jgi:hypothetical protein
MKKSGVNENIIAGDAQSLFPVDFCCHILTSIWLFYNAATTLRKTEPPGPEKSQEIQP